MFDIIWGSEQDDLVDTNCIRSRAQVINVQKRRELHVWPSGDKNGATIELTEISTPEKVMTIGIEHQDMEKVIKALEYLQLTSQSRRVLSYVDCLRVWVEEKSLF